MEPGAGRPGDSEAAGKPASPAKSEPTLLDRVFDGAPIRITFDPETCAKRDMGNLECGVEYEGRYDRQENRWTVTGPSRTDKKVLTFTAETGEAKPGSLAIWGMVGSFDED